MLRDEGREINHHGRVRKFDADGNEIEDDAEVVLNAMQISIIFLFL